MKIWGSDDGNVSLLSLTHKSNKKSLLKDQKHFENLYRCDRTSTRFEL